MHAKHVPSQNQKKTLVPHESKQTLVSLSDTLQSINPYFSLAKAWWFERINNKEPKTCNDGFHGQHDKDYSDSKN